MWSHMGEGFSANVIKVRSQRSSCMKVGLKCEDKFSDKRQKRGHRPREEGHEKIEVSTRVTLAYAKENCELPEAGRPKG